MAAKDLKVWLLKDALPLWAEHGVDRGFGGFHEKLDFDLRPVSEPHRARLTARQIYCFSGGHALGWEGPAQELVAHGLDFLDRHLLESDGRVLKAVDPGSGLPMAGHDAYDYAFVIFSLAAAARSLTDAPAAEAKSRRISEHLSRGWAHPLGGYQESMPATLPLRANPHMHLLEAFLEWMEVSGDRDGYWRERAASLVALALGRMLLGNGAMPEYFDAEWRAVPDEAGILIEPGHQFEWGWLLARWARLVGSEESFAAATRLIEIGERHGVDPGRGLVLAELHGDLGIRDRHAKLWPQTERIKAWYELATSPLSPPSLRERAGETLPRACAGLSSFLVEAPPGLWREVMTPDGSFVAEPVRASSFYHIVCAIRTMSETQQMETVGDCKPF